jgi:hypothetical protein
VVTRSPHLAVAPAANRTGPGFAQLEVPEIAEVDGQLLLMFSCLGKDLSLEKRASTAGGIWVAAAESPLGPYDLRNAQLITKSDMYVGRLIKKRDTGETVFLAFHHDGEKGDFIGEIIDPRSVSWDGRTLTFHANFPLTESSQIGQR